MDIHDLIGFSVGLFAMHQVFEASKVAFTGFWLLIYTIAYLLITKTEICNFISNL
jgi:hypothetical protein